MTKKDYVGIAGIISMHSEKEMSVRQRIMDEFIQDLAEYLQQDNPKFNKQKFIEACYGNM